MGIRINGTGDILKRTTSLPSAAAFTICGFAKFASIRASQFQYFAGVEDAESSSSNWLLIGFDNTGAFEITSAVGGGSSYKFAASPSTGTWIFFAISCEGTGANQLHGYWANVGATTLNSKDGTATSFTSAMMAVGNDSYDEWCDVHLHGVKVYDRALSSTELLEQMKHVSPVGSQANIHLWSSFNDTSDTTDRSGNGRNWTSAGTPANGDAVTVPNSGLDGMLSLPHALPILRVASIATLVAASVGPIEPPAPPVAPPEGWGWAAVAPAQIHRIRYPDQTATGERAPVEPPAAPAAPPEGWGWAAVSPTQFHRIRYPDQTASGERGPVEPPAAPATVPELSWHAPPPRPVLRPPRPPPASAVAGAIEDSPGAISLAWRATYPTPIYPGWSPPSQFVSPPQETSPGAGTQPYWQPRSPTAPPLRRPVIVGGETGPPQETSPGAGHGNYWQPQSPTRPIPPRLHLVGGEVGPPLETSSGSGYQAYWQPQSPLAPPLRRQSLEGGEVSPPFEVSPGAGYQVYWQPALPEFSRRLPTPVLTGGQTYVRQPDPVTVPEVSWAAVYPIIVYARPPLRIPGGEFGPPLDTSPGTVSTRLRFWFWSLG